MPLTIPNSDLLALTRLLNQHPRGLTLSEIDALQTLGLTKRTLQRRLATLVDSGGIRGEGDKKGRKYYPIDSWSEAKTGENEPPIVREHAGTPNPSYLSHESVRIRNLITRPLNQRKPVTFDRLFLDDYDPIRGGLLNEATKEHLRRLGDQSNQGLPAGTFVKQIYDRLLIDLSWNSSRLEGNTYSLLDTETLLLRGEEVTGKSALETQMILNHKGAIELLAEPSDAIGFNNYTLRNLHAILSDNLLPDAADGGKLRTKAVGISQSTYLPTAIPQVIDECFQIMLQKAEAIKNPFEASFFIMVYLPYLQPFVDVNKRVSRLAANISLIKHDYCPLSFVDIDKEDYLYGILGVYELRRIDYLRDVFVWAYERSCARYSVIRESLGEPDQFRLKYRSDIKQLVLQIVRTVDNSEQLPSEIGNYATAHIPKVDHIAFEQAIYADLKSLHSGNIARFGIRPSEFERWESSR